jgi:hypothetical protein
LVPEPWYYRFDTDLHLFVERKGNTNKVNLPPTVPKAAALVAAAMVLTPGFIAGQQCPQGRISGIEVVRLDVFDLEEFAEGSFMRGAFRTANTIHINTQETIPASRPCWRGMRMMWSTSFLRVHTHTEKGLSA